MTKGTPSTTINELSHLLHITQIGGYGKYLGLPESIGRTQTWDTEQLRSLFQLTDVQEILKLTPCITNVSDSPFWLPTQHGLYTVKSGYSVMRTLFCPLLSTHDAFSVILFIGWELWKARNKLLFTGKRLSIVAIINNAFLYHKLWCQVTADVSDQPSQYPCSPMRMLLPQISGPRSPSYCYIASNQQTGVAWILHTPEGHPFMQGSSSMSPLKTPLEAEALALRMAIQEITKLHYGPVIFMGACSPLYIPLSKCDEARKPTDIQRSIAMIVQDISRLCQPDNHTFQYLHSVRLLFWQSYLVSTHKVM
ncbi:unnamed protein product [Thlaspi arvense]|uniref:RNase H type-1 domain-containing protein n=1 Tax=Thlaspi arvense TaxID=13288 RepID=A0AAU9SAD4_THLAR|nr:unnamed protein product [Thlaspi arvense]